MTADEPWGGFYRVDGPVWMTGRSHVTLFCLPVTVKPLYTGLYNYTRIPSY